MNEKTDAELVLLTRAGNRDAFGCLVERYQQMVRRIAFRMLANDEIARELAQEALLQAYLSLDHLRDPMSFKSWLYGITNNVCRSYLRNQRGDVLSLESVMGGMRCDTLLDDTIDPQSVLEERELQRMVFDAVQTLSSGDRAAVLLFYYEQLTLREISGVLHVPETTVKGRLHRARKQLRERIAVWHEGIPSTRQAKKRRKKHMRKMTIESVREHPETQQHVVVLQDENTQQVVMVIWIGKVEAWAIAGGLNEVTPPRPMQAQLMLNLLQVTQAELVEVRIEALKEEIFYAILKIHSAAGEQEVDARPSDALSLAVLVKCPIFVTEDVISQVSGFPEGKLLRPLSTFRVINREVILKEQEESKAAFLKMTTALPEIEARLHKEEQAQGRQHLVEEWKKAHNKPEE